MYGDRLALFDNLTGGFGDGTLDRCLTSTEWQDRQLGSNHQFRGVMDVTFYGTGNNVLIRADTARRVCHIRLESPEEHPEERSDFKLVNLIAWVIENRKLLLAKALTVLRAFFLADCPDCRLKPWGSYESWSRLVRNAIVWCDLPDPGETRRMVQEQADVTCQGLRLLFCALEQMDPDRKGLTAGEIVAACDEKSPHPAAVRSILVAALDMLVTKPDSRKLGYKLRGLRRRIVDGKFLRLAGRSDSAVNRWVVVPASEFRQRPETSPPCAPCPAGHPGHGGHGGHDHPQAEMNGETDPLIVPGRPPDLFRDGGRLPD